MNKQRRKALSDINERIAAILEDLQNIIDEEQEAFDNLPESFQYGEKGEQMEEYISTMQDVYDYIEEQNENLWEIVDC